MAGNAQFQAIAVLSVESDMVRFSVVSSADGGEVASSARALTLITGDGSQPADDVHDGDTDSDSDSDSDDGYGYGGGGGGGGRGRGRGRGRGGGVVNHAHDELGRVEQDPTLVWDAVERVVNEAVDAMCRDGTPVTYIKSLAVVTEMSTVLAWDAGTGEPLHNAIHWTDARMAWGGTAAGAEWLAQRSAVVRACDPARRRLGTWDAWLLWHLTSGRSYGTDATNASYTRLLDLTTMDWDWDACRTRGLSERTWPAVRPHGEHCVVAVGRLRGTTVHAVMARPSAALYAHGCYRSGQVAVTMADLTSVAVGAAERAGPLQTAAGPWPVVGYREPNPANRDRPWVVYGLLAVSRANAVVQWMWFAGLVSSYRECMNAYNSARPTGPSQAFMVPALSGLPTAPHNRPDARLVVCGITRRMGREHLIAAGVDSMCYSVADLVRCVAPEASARVAFVDGAYVQQPGVLQQLANLSGFVVARNRYDMAVRGAARMAAAHIKAVYRDRTGIVEYRPAIAPERRSACVANWAKAVRRSYGWAQPDGPATVSDEFVPPARAATTYLTRALRAIGAYAMWCRTVVGGWLAV